MKETKVLGTGLAGLSASISLAMHGEKVAVYEQRHTVGGRFQTNIQAIRNYEFSQDAIKKLTNDCGLKLSKYNEIFKITRYAPSGKIVAVESEKKPLFFSFKRGPNEDSLDNHLYNQATDAGVNFEFNKREKIQQVDVVAAGSLFFNIVGSGIHFNNTSLETDTIHFFLDNNFASKGYFCIIPFEDEATLLAVSFEEKEFPRLRKNTRRIVEENKVVKELLDGAEVQNEHGGGSHYNIPASAKIGGKYFVGEAAGFVEAARGFGQYYALVSGYLAGKAISDKLDYDELWKKEFLEDLTTAFKRRIILDRLENEDYEKMLNDESRKISVEYYREKKEKLHINFLREFLLQDQIGQILEKHRKKYDLAKIV